MIQNGTYLNVIDNSGAKIVGCIQVKNGFKKRYASMGDIIVVSVKSLRNKRRITSKVKKGEVLKALIVRTKSRIKESSNKSINFFENSVILLTNNNRPLGTRIFGVLPKFFRFTKHFKIASLSAGLIS
jgi:large subunit ribosomal protein L14|tara:strand:- start:3646 stop:4029 length:384 start_codon:yes stop_codon:yes gene_type:complete